MYGQSPIVSHSGLHRTPSLALAHLNKCQEVTGSVFLPVHSMYYTRYMPNVISVYMDDTFMH